MVFDERTDGRVSLAGVVLAAILIAVGLPGLALGDPPTLVPSAGGSDSDSAAAATQSSSTQSSASSATAAADDELPNLESTRSRFARSLRISKVVKSDEISNDKSAEIKLGSGGVIRISKNDQGDLVVTVEQNEAGEVSQTRRIEGRDPDRSDLGPRRTGGESGFSGRTRSGGGSASSFGTTVRRNVVRESGGSDSRPDIDRQLLQSDVELAEVGLLEKRAELEIAQKAGADPGRLKLAELAVRRAQIEFKRATLKSQAADSKR